MGTSIGGDDLLKAIPKEYHNVLRENIFFKPFDEISQDSNTEQRESVLHPILLGDL